MTNELKPCPFCGERHESIGSCADECEWYEGDGIEIDFMVCGYNE